MCGICGFYSNNNHDFNIIKKMNNIMEHRGPDGKGIFQEITKNGRHMAFGHRRLAILELSDLGNQPMINEEGNVVVIFNGEIYNYKDISHELKNEGYEIQSNCDTEIVLKAYERWGINCINKFNGMFAIAIYNKNKEEIYLVRDRIGIKPIYYFYDDKNFVFASELKAIMQFPNFKKEINFKSLELYLINQYIPAPYTIFENTYKLEPGNYMKIGKNNVSVKKYWSIDEEQILDTKKKYTKKDEEEYIEKLETLIKDAVKSRMISDVPIGSFLSGGVDSSLISAIMQDLSEKPIKTFTIGFDKKKYNEAEYAKEISQYLGTDHYEKYLTEKDLLEVVKNIPKYYDEPFADNSQLATLILSEVTKEKVTVSLSGDGGDEFYCGYTKYLNATKLKKYSKILNPIGKTLQILGLKERVSKFNRKLSISLFNGTDDYSIINSNNMYTRDIVKNLLKTDFKFGSRYSISDLDLSIEQKYMLYDIKSFLPDDILVKVDRASMASSLEVRTPFLDHRLVEHSLYKLPHQLKINGEVQKYALRKILSKYLPERLFERPKKGFSVPLNSWLKGELVDLINCYFSENYIKKQGIFNYTAVQNILKRFKTNENIFEAKIIWTILVFQLWFDEYMNS